MIGKQEVISSLVAMEGRLARSMAICALSQLLTKHDYDARYQLPLKKERVALIYFPLLPLVRDFFPTSKPYTATCILPPPALQLVDNFVGMEKWRSEAGQLEKRGLYISLLWLLKSGNRELLRQWWRHEPLPRCLHFLNILSDIIDSFEVFLQPRVLDLN